MRKNQSNFLKNKKTPWSFIINPSGFSSGQSYAPEKNIKMFSLSSFIRG